ncbi:MAG: riboflavin synthase [Candidatus Omnitrophica bacterium]|nr:riboflavin synthase [Candidatus Omnitrophota bacterium]
MFTGIIEEIGTVVQVSKRSNTTFIGIKGMKVLDDLKKGDSISVDGVCLTVEDIKQQTFYASLSLETLRLTTFEYIKHGTLVNLERAVKYGSRVGGHLLSGHIDFKARIISKRKEGENSIILVRVPSKFSVYFLKKGSVGIDGISLTIADIVDDTIAIWLIPYTIENTTMKFKKAGDYVNVEIDMMIKALIENRLNLKRKDEKISKEAVL